MNRRIRAYAMGRDPLDGIQRFSVLPKIHSPTRQVRPVGHVRQQLRHINDCRYPTRYVIHTFVAICNHHNVCTNEPPKGVYQGD